MQTTLIIVKPDAMHRGLMGRIITRLEEKGMRIAGAKLMKISPELAAKHYEMHQGKPFYDGLIKFMTGTPVMVLAVTGRQAIDTCRKLMGATAGFRAEPGTIRGDFGSSQSYNLVHGSDSPESAQRELALFFTKAEIFDYERAIDPWVVDMSGGRAQ